jgi:uncharacterized protein with HEPN domain
MKNKIITTKIIAYIEKILEYCNGYSYEEFCANSLVIDACVFNLSQIGELANKIDKNFAAAHSDVPWKKLYSLRNRIVHDYEGINYTLIWEIIQNDLPTLQQRLAAI